MTKKDADRIVAAVEKLTAAIQMLASSPVVQRVEHVWEYQYRPGVPYWHCIGGGGGAGGTSGGGGGTSTGGTSR